MSVKEIRKVGQIILQVFHLHKVLAEQFIFCGTKTSVGQIVLQVLNLHKVLEEQVSFLWREGASCINHFICINYLKNRFHSFGRKVQVALITSFA